MAIEIPNSFQACAFCDPNLLPDDPFFVSNGFQEYNPATNGADPAQTVGGFTQVAVGTYLLKTEMGSDPFESMVVFGGSPAFVAGSYIPFGVPAPGTYPDGFSIFVEARDIVSGDNVDAGFYIGTWRHSTGPNAASFP